MVTSIEPREEHPATWMGTSKGFDIHARTNHHGLWCGYLDIPRDHPWFGKNTSDLEGIEVHGGITYARQGDDADTWCIGFDCAHAFDMGEGSKSIEFVVNELRRLSEEAELSARSCSLVDAIDAAADDILCREEAAAKAKSLRPTPAGNPSDLVNRLLEIQGVEHVDVERGEFTVTVDGNIAAMEKIRTVVEARIPKFPVHVCIERA